MTAVRGVSMAWKELLFPRSCSGCSCWLSSSQGALCRQCLKGIAGINSPLCSLCGEGFGSSASGDHICGQCLKNPPPFLRARAVSRYEEPVSSFLHALKYGGDFSILPAIAEIVALRVPFEPAPHGLVVPVPLHPRRLRQRGFNQAVLIAELFFPKNRDQLRVDILRRIRHTEPQTALDGVQRRKNLINAFDVSNCHDVTGKEIILVDDVFTTGATAIACSRALLWAGAKEVRVLTVARV